jgi:hypothetical protein
VSLQTAVPVSYAEGGGRSDVCDNIKLIAMQTTVGVDASFLATYRHPADADSLGTCWMVDSRWSMACLVTRIHLPTAKIARLRVPMLAASPSCSHHPKCIGRSGEWGGSSSPNAACVGVGCEEREQRERDNGKRTRRGEGGQGWRPTLKGTL